MLVIPTYAIAVTRYLGLIKQPSTLQALLPYVPLISFLPYRTAIRPGVPSRDLVADFCPPSRPVSATGPSPSPAVLTVVAVIAAVFPHLSPQTQSLMSSSSSPPSPEPAPTSPPLRPLGAGAPRWVYIAYIFPSPSPSPAPTCPPTSSPSGPRPLPSPASPSSSPGAESNRRGVERWKLHPPHSPAQALTALGWIKDGDGDGDGVGEEDLEWDGDGDEGEDVDVDGDDDWDLDVTGGAESETVGWEGGVVVVRAVVVDARGVGVGPAWVMADLVDDCGGRVVLRGGVVPVEARLREELEGHVVVLRGREGVLVGARLELAVGRGLVDASTTEVSEAVGVDHATLDVIPSNAVAVVDVAPPSPPLSDTKTT